MSMADGGSACKRSAKMRIEGMDCGACAIKIEGALPWHIAHYLLDFCWMEREACSHRWLRREAISGMRCYQAQGMSSSRREAGQRLTSLVSTSAK